MNEVIVPNHDSTITGMYRYIAELERCRTEMLTALKLVMDDAADPYFQVAGCLPSETYKTVETAYMRCLPPDPIDHPGGCPCMACQGT